MRKWADLMATSGQFYWPSVGNFVAAYGQFFMAAYIPGRLENWRSIHLKPMLWARTSSFMSRYPRRIV